MKRKWINWLPVVLWMLVIFIGSSIPDVPRVGGRTLDSWVHRLAHVIEYAILGWLLARALAQGRTPSRRTIILTLIGVILYGVSDELHQRFTPGRNGDLIAVVWDGLGGLIGAGWQRIRHEYTNRQRMGSG